MNRVPQLLVLSMMLAGCPGDGGNDTGPTLDTGWFTADDACQAIFLSITPEDETTGWYWRDVPTLFVDVPYQDAEAGSYAAQLTDSAGAVVPTHPRWDPTGLMLELAPVEPLEALSTYRLEVSDCAGSQVMEFRTSAYGAPLTDGPESLVRSTYVIDLTKATWIEPGGFGGVLSLVFNAPVLIGVEWSDEQYVDLLGAQGYLDDFGSVKQATTEPTWDLPIADFAQAPYFEAASERIVLDVSGLGVPISDFVLAGTFSADGSTLGGGEIRGLGDTRNMGALFGADGDPNAVCAYALTLGVQCVPCEDEEPYCLYLSAKDIEAQREDGLTLVRISSE